MYWNSIIAVACLQAIVCGAAAQEKHERVITSLKYSKFKINAKVVEGEPAQREHLPYIVSFRRPERIDERKTVWQNVCGGSIISPFKILTAAHCFESKNFYYVRFPKELRVTAGSLGIANIVQVSRNYSDAVAQWRDVETIAIHENYYFPADDIAVAVVEEAWKFNDVVNMIHIATDSETEFTNCVVAGYGFLTNESTVPVLYFARISLIPKQNCSLLWEMDMDSYICSDTILFADVNTDDAGGPLVCDQMKPNSMMAEKELLAGIICGRSYDKTTLFTRVSNYLDFIDNSKQAKGSIRIGEVVKKSSGLRTARCSFTLMSVIIFVRGVLWQNYKLFLA